ncbi:uncharacterized protein LOC131880106 isoform X2 [Tigriopus californicus]|uniref:uncharacterized protein LOC131880106 isoform X2 n=1 Tax=Tigriopus californicus TaxID=6832 RepID=UPI0027D9DE03|nr:uncharacterized protein LOC131880106 isoform X2 [Tigriopus californicus]
MATPGRPPSSGMARKSTSKASIPTARKSTSSASSVSSVTPQVASHRFAMESDSHDPSALTDPTFQVPRQHRYAERTSGRVSSKNPIFDNSLERRRSRTLRPRESMSINYARNGGVKQMGDRERRKAANAAKQTLIAKSQNTLQRGRDIDYVSKGSVRLHDNPLSWLSFSVPEVWVQ